MDDPEYEPLRVDRAGEKIDEDRCYEHVNRLADDASWFETTDGHVWAVTEADRFECQFWQLWDLLIVDWSYGTRAFTSRVTHVEREESILVGPYEGDIDSEDASTG